MCWGSRQSEGWAAWAEAAVALRRQDHDLGAGLSEAGEGRYARGFAGDEAAVDGAADRGVGGDDILPGLVAVGGVAGAAEQPVQGVIHLQCAHHRRHPPVQVPAHGLGLAGGLGVEIHHHHIRPFPGQDGVGAAERVVAGGHVDPAHQIDDQHLLAARRVELDVAVAGGARRIIGGPQQPRLNLEGGHDVFNVEGVIARGDDVNTQLIQPLPGDPLGDPMAVGRIFPIDNDEIQGKLPLERRQVGLHQLAPRFPHDIAKNENPHRGTLAALGPGAPPPPGGPP